MIDIAKAFGDVDTRLLKDIDEVLDFITHGDDPGHRRAGAGRRAHHRPRRGAGTAQDARPGRRSLRRCDVHRHRPRRLDRERTWQPLRRVGRRWARPRAATARTSSTPCSRTRSCLVGLLLGNDCVDRRVASGPAARQGVVPAELRSVLRRPLRHVRWRARGQRPTSAAASPRAVSGCSPSDLLDGDSQPRRRRSGQRVPAEPLPGRPRRRAARTCPSSRCRHDQGRREVRRPHRRGRCRRRHHGHVQPQPQRHVRRPTAGCTSTRSSRRSRRRSACSTSAGQAVAFLEVWAQFGVCPFCHTETWRLAEVTLFEWSQPVRRRSHPSSPARSARPATGSSS